MADIVVTAANVIPQSGLRQSHGVAGAALTIGQAVYQKSSDRRWYPSDKDVDEDDAIDYGLTLSQAAAAGQPVVVTRGRNAGKLSFGAILTVGETYCVGEAAGGICPIADVGAGERLRHLGVASTTALLDVDVKWLNTDHG
jgi:hypothetical protein